VSVEPNTVFSILQEVLLQYSLEPRRLRCSTTLQRS